MLSSGNQKRKESELNDESLLNVHDLKKTKNMAEEKVAILDAGAQYTKLIDRRVRELAVKSDLLPLEVKAKELCENNYRAIIISGGPKSVYENNALTCDPEIFKLGLPILGICYGMHIICKHFGGTVKKTNVREDGEFIIEIKPCLLFKNMNQQQKVLLTHGDTVEVVPENFEEIAKSSSLISGIANDQMRIYGLQFHPEVDLTENGLKMFSNFLYEIAGLSGTYTLVNREIECINYIRSRIGSKKAILLVSGGVDSSVCAALLQKSLPKDQIVAIHIDNGFMRRNESANVETLLSQIGVHVNVVIAGYKFKQGKLTLTPDVANTARKYLVTKPLCMTTAPEEKRRIIGDVFVKVFEEEVKNLNLEMDDVFLVQGTLRPDLIESGSSLASGSAAVIKTHHNDTNMIRYLRKMNRVVEPLSDFHKDEVKKLALELNLPSEIVYRKPFPGPGLAIRILCSNACHIDETFSLTETMVKVICQYAKKRELRHALFDRVNSYLADDDRKRLEVISQKHELSATLLPIKTVGVQGDCRSYSHAVAISCDEEPDWNDLSYLAQIIPRVCHNVNRVCYAFGKRITVPVRELTRVLLTDSFIDILREADYRTTTFMEQNNCENCYSQFPVVLIPVHFDRIIAGGIPSVQVSIVLRPFCTNDFMTGRPALPGKDIPLDVISKMVEILSSISRVSRILYDLTSKPPGTVEWE